MKIKILLIVLVCSLSSCISTKKLQKKLNGEKIEVNTLHFNSKSNSHEKLDISLVIIDTLKNNDTEVSKNKKYVIPLIILNIHHLDYQIKLGQNNLSEKLSKTLYNEFIEETKRSANFNIKSSSSYILKIDFNEIDYQTKFIEDFFGFWSMATTTRKVLPENASIELNVSLYDKNKKEIIFDKKYNETHFSKNIGDEEIMSTNDLKKVILNNFNASLSENLENIINKIIKDINELSKTLANNG